MNFSSVYNTPEPLLEELDQLFIVGSGSEERSNWWKPFDRSKFKEIVELPNSCISFVDYENEVVELSSRTQLEGLLAMLIEDKVKLSIDVTSLPHHVWAPLIRASISSGYDVDVVYIEPNKYSPPVRGVITSPYNLSEKILGIGPIPGFSFLSDEFETDYGLVVFLGFEGKRFGYILNEVDAESDRIIPVIGVPGFKPEFMDIAYDGNRDQLENYRCASRMRYAPAYCPFSVVRLLQKIEEDEGYSLLKIAPIGTKPHALGGLLYSLISSKKIEFIYDHPVRKSDRSTGIGKCHVYRISAFLS